jgi:tetratricopeptide (TPR) repeat protein
MSHSFQLIASSAFAGLLLGVALQAQTKQTNPGQTKLGSSSLQGHYEAAQHAQQSENLSQAAKEYRAFLCEAQEKLALGHAGVGDWARAAGLFDQAVALEPDSWSLRLEYAKTAVASGDFSRAEAQARAVIDGSRDDSTLLAEAHQTLGRALLKRNQDQDARKEMEEAVKLNPTFANGYGLAVACLDLDDEKCATQMFQEMERSFGDTPAIHMQFGMAYGNSDFVPQAIAEFRKTIAENPRFSGAHYSLAAALLSAGDDAKNMQEAETELKKELEISPRDFLTYAALGKLAVTNRRYGEAETYLKRATALNPENSDAFLYLGQMYFDTNRPVDAETALRKAIELTRDPSRNRYQIQKAHFLLGRLLMQEHKPDEAHAEMAKAQRLANKDLSHDKNALAGLLSNAAATGAGGELEDPNQKASNAALDSGPAARNDLSAFERRLSPAIADSYNNLGVIAASNQNYEEALDDFQQAAKWNPKLEGLDLNWGRAAFLASKYTEALAPLSRYVRVHPEDSGVRGALAMSQFMTGDYAGCVATFSGAEEKLASIPQMEYVYADSLVRTGEVGGGRSRLESLETAHPEVGEVHRSLGELYASLGDPLKATRELKTAILLNASDAESHYELGRIETKSGDVAAAILELETATKFEPENPLYHRELAAAYRLASRRDDAARQLEIYQSLENHAADGDKPAAGIQENPRGK